MALRTVTIIIILFTQVSHGQWANCSEVLTAFSKARTESGPSKWKASSWRDDRFPQKDFPQVSDSRFYGYGSYGKYYKARTSLRRGFWIKEFLMDYRDVLRKTDSPLDLPTSNQLADMGRAAAESEEGVLKFLGTEVSMPFGMRAIKTRGLATPFALRYAEAPRGRVLSSILNDESIELEYRELLWKQFQDGLLLLKKSLASRRDHLEEADEIDGYGMKYYTILHTFSVTICGTLFDPETEEFVIIDPFYFD
jgi:hypothetical protein